MRSNARRRSVATAAGVVLGIVGAVVIVLALQAQRSAPQPPRSAALPVSVVPSTAAREAPAGNAGQRSANQSPSTRFPDAGRPAGVRGLVLPSSRPVALRIPAIGVRSPLRPLGLNPDHTVQVPPLSRDSYAGWYRYSPAPGSVGPSVILGHIDSAAYGPGVFFRLGDLRQRDRIYVVRADGTVAVFEVERVVEYPKNRFPTLQVYGNVDHAALRLITCGGKFDFSTRNYQDNIVAYAALVSDYRTH